MHDTPYPWSRFASPAVGCQWALVPRPCVSLTCVAVPQVRLGPAFVKIGQALSSRPDVLPPVYISALELLQDKIPAFDDGQAMQGAHTAAQRVPVFVLGACMQHVRRGHMQRQLCVPSHCSVWLAGPGARALPLYVQSTA